MRRIFYEARYSVAFCGLLIVTGSVLASVGIWSYIGLPATLIIVEVIPFFALAVGVDNMFILVHELERRTEDSIEERVAEALGRMGPSILVSSLCQVVVFALGGLVVMPAVSSFALYAALATWIGFLLQITVFVSFLALDAKRSEVGEIHLRN